MFQVYHWVRAHRYFVLLLALFSLAVSQPLAGRFEGGALFFDGLASLVLFAVVLIVFPRHRERIAALVLAVPAVLTKWATYPLAGVDDRVLDIVHHVTVVLFLGFAIFVILRGIFEQAEIQSDHLLGTICGYVLAGVAWGNAYSAIDLYAAKSFRIAPEILAKISDEHYRSVYFNYFSLCTLTNAGFGDISPTAPFATTLTWLEAAFGQFYIAVVVAQLVGLRLAQAIRRVTEPRSERGSNSHGEHAWDASSDAEEWAQDIPLNNTEYATSE
jgi:voltage-gated potassium channel